MGANTKREIGEILTVYNRDTIGGTLNGTAQGRVKREATFEELVAFSTEHNGRPPNAFELLAMERPFYYEVEVD